MRKPFQIMAKPTGAKCNMVCKYCYYLSKRQIYKPNHATRMSDLVLREFTRQYMASQDSHDIVFAWQGGEPTLMGIDFFRQALSYQMEFRRPDQCITNTIQTNGLIIDDEWAAFLGEHQFLVGLSMDGPQDCHDVFRRSADGGGTFNRVYETLQLLKRHGVAFNVLCVVSSANVDKPREVYQFFREEGIQYIQFIPAASHPPNANASFGIEPMGWGSFLSEVFDQWANRDVGQIFVMNFEAMLSAWCGLKPTICIHQERCGQTLVMEHNGDIYACDFFVDLPHRRGNIFETDLATLARSPAQTAFGRQKVERLPVSCRQCPALFVCNGGCPADRNSTDKKSRELKNHFCDGYRHFYEHAAPFMEKISSMLKDYIPVTQATIHRAQETA